MIIGQEKLAGAVRDKLTAERKDVKGQKESAVAPAVLDALCDFARQDAEFADAILQSSASFADCMAAVCKGVGSCLSDIEAYRRAVAFYFPGAGISVTMRVDLCASVNGANEGGGGVAGAMELSLDDLFS